jgi:hypothetical protein
MTCQEYIQELRIQQNHAVDLEEWQELEDRISEIENQPEESFE